MLFSHFNYRIIKLEIYEENELFKNNLDSTNA